MPSAAAPPTDLPPPSPAARLILIAIQAYRLTLSALLGRQCRFAPTCSEYTAEAVRSHGALRGGWLGLKRIGRCHPWGGSGYDPVPPRRPMEPSRGT